VIKIYLNAALKRQLGVLPNLYNAGFWHVVWVIRDVTQSDFSNMLGSGAAKCLKVPLQSFSSTPNRLLERYLSNWQVYLSVS